MDRRHFILAALGTGLGSVFLARPGLAATHHVEVFKSPTCGCCAAWLAHMWSAGFAVKARDVDQETLTSLKAQAGITPDLGACHTSFVDGYVVEGHVPAADVQRLLAERPDARGLAVPGMPIGSPGMETGDRREKFDTLLILGDGRADLFQRHD